ncbi:MAG: M20/M25/M40 family metallo-hydrolase, partial [Deltaproteobacteria bacterium]|nr:M20/M25/M40 family metallo-hydrolase [Deltaproteobacteria bacterium]
RANPAFRSSLESETVQLAMTALAAAGLPLETNAKAGCTEAGVYANAGVSPVVFGPGPSTGVIHAPNEYNLISEVEGALRFYRELLRL